MTEHRKHCLRILRRYWTRDFSRPENLPRYIERVRERLRMFGIDNVPEEPIPFLAFCQELGLFGKRTNKPKTKEVQ